MSRTQNVKINLIFNTVKFATQLLLQFILRTVLIYLMGDEYLGLNGLFTNIFSFLNLAELGIGSAIVFNMYKPIADGDIEKVKSLQSLYKRFYCVIAIVVASVGLILLPFIKYFIKGGVTVDINIYLLYALYLINTLFGYFSAHKRSLLFAYQRNDVENKVKTICLFGMTIGQIIVLLLFKNYYIYFIVNIIFTMIENILIQVQANKLYPEINGKSQPLDKDTKKEIGKNVAALSMHKVGAVIVGATDNILISSILGVSILGIYTNYYMIVSSLVAVFALLLNSLTGSVGNLVASSDKDYAYSRYKQIQLIFSLLASFSTVCMIILFQPFMNVWTKGKYLLNFSTAILIGVSFYITRMRNASGIFIDCTGIFWKNRYAPLIESVLNLVVSIVLGIFIGINGIILGTIISTLLVPFWVEPKVLYKHYFKRNVWEFFKRYLYNLIVTILIGLVCYFVCSFIPDGGIWLLIAKFAACVPLCGVLLLIAYAPTKEFKSCVKWLLDIFKNRKKKTEQ